jgi:hypothetical protein
MTVTYRYVLAMIVIAILLTLGVMETQEVMEIPYLRRPSD